MKLNGLIRYGRLLSSFRGTSALSVGLAAGAGLLEAVGISSLLPLLSRDAEVVEGLSNVALGAAVVAIVLAGSSVMRHLSDRAIARVVTAVERNARADFTELLLRARWGKVSALPQGQATAAIMSEATQLSNGVYALLNAAASAVIVLVLCVAAFAVTPLLFLIATVFMSFTSLIFAIRTKHVRDNEREMQSATTDAGEKVSGVLPDLKYLRSTSAGLMWAKNTLANIDRLRALRSRQLILPSVTRTMTDVAGAVFLGAVIGASLLFSDVATALVFVGLFYRLIPRLQAAQSALATASGQLEWLIEWDRRMVSLSADVSGGVWKRDTSRVVANPKREWSARPAPEVEFYDVWFRHDGSEKSFLRGVSFVLASESIVALVGPSGAGKTTVLDLLLGLETPYRGHVTINGVDAAAAMSASSRDAVGFVPQDVRLKSGTIAENISWVENVDMDRLQAAIRFSSLDGWIDTLPAGLMTHLEGTGIGLSGGQRQRIGLARALYHRPSLLILDEATSALDEMTERDVIQSLRSLPWPVTCLVVTHRRAVLSEVDMVLSLHDGLVVQRGMSE